jgi:hypothetical protein
LKTHVKPDAARSAAAFGCTIEQAKRLMSQNAASLLQMADKAKRTGKLVNGYSEADLRASAEEYRLASL